MATLTSKLIVELIDRASAPSRAIAGAVNRLTAMQSRNAAALASAQTQMLGAVGAAYALGKAISAPIKAAKDFQTTLSDIRQKSGLSANELDALGKSIRGIATATNQLPSATGKTFDALLGLGLGGETDQENIDAALKLLPAINKTAAAFRAQNEDVMRAGQAVFANLKVPAEQVQLAFDMMAASGNAGAFELRDMAESFPSITAQAQALGIKGTKGVADLAAALQVVRQGAGNASEAATNMRDLFSQLLSPRLATNFKKFGVDLRKSLAEGAKKGESPIDTVIGLTQKAMKKGASIGDLFRNQQSMLAMSALLADTKRYHQIRDEAAKASGLVEEEYAKRIKDSDSAIVRFQASIENLNIELGSGLLPILNDVIDRGVLPLVRAVTAAVKAFPRAAGVVTAVAAGLIGLRIAGIAAKFGMLWMWGGALAIAKGAMLGLAGAVRLASIAMLPFGAALRAARTGMVGFAAASAILGTGGALRMAGASMIGLLNPIKLVTGALRILKLAVIGTGIGAVLVGIAAAGMFIYNNWSLVKSLFAGIGEGIMSALQPVMPVVQPLIDGFGWLSDKISSLLGPLDASNESWRATGVIIGETIGGAITSVIEKIKSLLGWFASVPGKIAGMFSAVGSGVKAPTGAATPAVAGARAAGGPVRAGSTYLVGENGPELFRARANGAIASTLDTVRAIKAQALVGAARQSGGGAVTNVGGVTINVQAAPGQSPEAIASAVEKQLSSKLNALSRGAYSDGVY